jgi:zinc protease
MLNGARSIVGLLVMVLAATVAPWANAAVPEVVTRTLPNGHQLYIVENHQQAAVTLDTWVGVGSVNETAPVNGVSHFLEHLLFKGTPQWPTGSIDKWLDSRGAGYNAATSQDFTHYYITVAKPFFAEALGMHAQMLQQSNFPAEEVDRERLVVQEEINRAHNRPGHRLFEALQAVLYKGHPYEQTTLGPKSVIAGVPRQAILDYWCQWYQPSQLKTILVGDITPDEAEAAVIKAFGQRSPDCKPNAKVQPPAIATIATLTQPEVSILPDPGVRQVYGMVAFVAPPASRWQDAVALDAAMDALGGGPSSRLYQRLRNKEQLVQDISAANMTQRYGGALYVSFETSADKVKPAVAAILEEINRLTAHGITPEELSSYQHQTARSFIFQAEQTDALASSIGYNVAIGSLQDYTEYLPRLQGLTLAQVRSASRQWLVPGQAALVAVVPESDQSSLAASDFKAMLMQAAPVTVKVNGGTTVADSPSPASSAPVVTESSLPNGVRLIAKPLAQAQTVTLQLLVKGGQRTEGKPGTAALMARLLNAGPTTRSEAEWLRLLESQSLGISVGAGKDEWTLTATAAKEDVGELLTALRELVASPAMALTVFTRERALMAKDITAAQDEPLSLAMEKAQLALYPAHPYGHVGHRVLQALPTLTHREVTDYFKQSFQPDNLTAIATGDFDPTTLKAFLASLPFPGQPVAMTGAGSLPAPQKGAMSKPVSSASVQPSVAQLKLVKSQSLETRKPSQAATWLVQSWLAPPATSADYPALKVMSTLLGGGMSSRLFVELREKQGLAYAVGSQYGGSYDPGVFAMYIGTDPKNEAAVKAGFDQQVKRLKAGEVSAAELQAAKDQVVGKFALAHETPADHARYLGTYESVGLGYAYDEQFPKAIAAVTLADVVRVANTYLGAPSITSLVGPTQAKTP